MARIGFVGGGKMAEALIAGILQGSVVQPGEIICSDVLGQRRELLRQKYGIEVTDDNGVVFDEAEMVFLAFKPQGFPTAIEGLKSRVQPGQVFISILAGVRLSKLQEHLGPKVVRMMPNTGCLVGQMAAGYTAAQQVSQEELDAVRPLLECAGTAVQVSEAELDGVTGLSGSGPAFVAYLIDCFTAAGVKAGLTQAQAADLAVETFAGTAKLLKQQQMQPSELIEMVSSPNGTTVAGREILEASDVAEVIERTILRAAQRSKELGAQQ
ncbi:MAG: pyrroline-5-carboxylate reductase [Sedimentisphaerales bacterium]|nr:pyrroline-5-carboxylate reductase [Sedimentisphaerales bacterium]